MKKIDVKYYARRAHAKKKQLSADLKKALRKKPQGLLNYSPEILAILPSMAL